MRHPFDKYDNYGEWHIERPGIIVQGTLLSNDNLANISIKIGGCVDTLDIQEIVTTIAEKYCNVLS